jgi:hypothetical protein
MKSYLLFSLISLMVVSTMAGTYTNTTSFWQTMLNESQLHFQVYSGIVSVYIRLRISWLVFPQRYHWYVL